MQQDQEQYDHEVFWGNLKALIDMDDLDVENVIQGIEGNYSKTTLEEYYEHQSLSCRLLNYQRPKGIAVLLELMKKNPEADILTKPFRDDDKSAPTLLDQLKASQGVGDLTAIWLFVSHRYPQLFQPKQDSLGKVSWKEFEALLNKISNGGAVRQELLPYVNATSHPHYMVFDVFLHQMFWDALENQGIALLPTMHVSNRIPQEQLGNLGKGMQQSYLTTLSVTGNEIQATRKNKVFSHQIDYAIWPMFLSNNHYQLFFLDLSKSKGFQYSGGLYFIPLSEDWYLFRCMDRGITGLTDEEVTAQGTRKDALDNLGSTPKGLERVCCFQQAEESYSSDLIIYVLAQLALGQVKLKDDFFLNTIRTPRFNESSAKRVRQQQIEMFGEAYFLYQLKDKTQRAAALQAFHSSLSSSSSAAASAAAGPGFVPHPSSLFYHAPNTNSESAAAYTAGAADDKMQDEGAPLSSDKHEPSSSASLS